ncbi:MAG: hypothetical protein JXA54_07975 [Candidatus Heimdallarchaeota archaeon]|nr:hypothetical protein [Candidatus Heimdallarchaeota archaeon]
MDKTEKQIHYNINNIEKNLARLYEIGAQKEVICVYRMLCKANNCSTNELIELAFSSDFESDCLTCASAESIYRGLRNLQEKGWIIGHLSKGGYIWKLITD